MKSRQSYKLPLILSILLHGILFVFLFMHFSSKEVKKPREAHLIKAVIVSEHQLATKESMVPKVAPLPQNSIRRIEQAALKQPETPKTLVEQKLPKAPEEPAITMPSPKLIPAPKEQLVSLQEPKMDFKKGLEQKLHKIEAEKKTVLAKKRRAEDLKLLQNELANEAKQMEHEVTNSAAEQESETSQDEPKESAKGQDKELEDKVHEKEELGAQAAQVDAGEMNKFKRMIIEAISRRWLIPENTSQDLACQLLVHVGPGGIVLNVDVIKESGNENLDRSALNAIMKASPLPVPEHAELFDNFRSLRLTFRPQGIVSG
jgi:colicin import membrane protein